MDALANARIRMVMSWPQPAAAVICSNVQRGRTCYLCLILQSILQTYHQVCSLGKCSPMYKQQVLFVIYLKPLLSKYNWFWSLQSTSILISTTKAHLVSAVSSKEITCLFKDKVILFTVKWQSVGDFPLWPWLWLLTFIWSKYQLC